MDTLDGKIPQTQLEFHRNARPDGVTVLAVTGEVDLTTDEAFRQALGRLVSERDARRLLLDLAQLRFIDSTGVNVLVQTQRTAEQDGRTFGIINAGGAVRSVLEMLGVYQMLAMREPKS